MVVAPGRQTYVSSDRVGATTGRGFVGATTGRGFVGATTGRGFVGATTGRGFVGATTGRGFVGATTGRGFVKMRVALVLKRFDPRRGGLENWTYQFAGRLIQRGHEVHVVAGGFAGPARSLPIVAHPLPPTKSRLRFAEAAQAELLSFAPDVIHDMGFGWYCDVFQPHGGSFAAVTQRKLLLHRRYLRPLKRRIDGILPRQREFRALMERQYADNGQLLLALSRSVADDFQHYHGVPPDRIRTVYNGVDTSRFSPRQRPKFRRSVRRELGIGDETIGALIVAHDLRLKGLATLLRAMRHLKNESRPIHLTVVGGKRIAKWQRTARRLGVNSMVSFVGPQDDTVPYYAAADVYVHPTFYDPCSLVVLEAAASGLPVITTRCNGASELFEDGVQGWLLSDPTDAGRLAAAMRTMLDDPLRQQMGRAARATATEHTFDRGVDEILAVYAELVSSQRPSVGHVYNVPTTGKARWKRATRLAQRAP